MTNQNRQQGRIFHGWWVVLVAGIGLFFCYIPMVSFTFGLFAEPLIREFNWSRTGISLAFSISLIAMCLAMPVVGRLVDRFGGRKVIVPSVLVLGLCFVSFYFLSGSLGQFYAIYLVMGLVGGGSATLPYCGVVSHWFDKKRGLALSLAAAGAGLGSLVVPPVVQLLISAVGWRNAYVLMGATITLVTAPTVTIFLKERPQMMGLLPDGDAVENAAPEKEGGQEQGVSGKEALRSGTFWMICVAFFFVAASAIGCLIHLVPMLTDRGASAQSAAMATALLGGASLVGGLIAGYLLDRFFASYVAIGFFTGAAIGIFCLWSGTVGGLAFIAAFLIGLGMGAAGQIIPYLVSRYFGLLSFGEIYSYALISFSLGGVVGPLLMGLSFDSTGSYRFGLTVFFLTTLIATGLMMRLGPYRVWQPAVVEPTIA
ncbi:MFS transporter [soil metagenome]